MIIDKGVVQYAEKEPGRDVTVRSRFLRSRSWSLVRCGLLHDDETDCRQVSSAAAVLAKL
jgi:hypothetical protein